MRKKFVFLWAIILILVLLTGCSDSEPSNLQQEKLVEQIRYLDAKIVGMLNKLNNISFDNYAITTRQIGINTNGNENEESEDFETILSTEMVPDTVLLSNHDYINWEILKQEIELLNSAWATIILNLYSMEIDAEEILAFSRDLDIAIINIKGEDKRGSLTSLARLYSHLPKYLENIEEEVITKHIKQTKAFVLNAYALVEQRNWAEVASNIVEADNAFRNILSDIDYVRSNEFKVNRTYVLLKELERSIEFRDSEIFFMNYRNLMQALNTM
ncbi:MAG: hypothetical protein FWC68_02950 [Oscillospiraceae bacterium]|nr:hypothetical protein [Oscillospiraceae bacterium]